VIANLGGKLNLKQEVGDLAKRLGHRLTTHPGQFTQLVSPKPKVVENSIRELECECFLAVHKVGLDCDA
jgi:UV DNA damage endonuclease